MTQRERSQLATAMQGVELHRHPHPDAKGALGAAEGNHVYLDLRDDFFGSPRSMELLGHELAHVLQQRQGRVAASDGARHNADPLLEAEADAMARDFPRLQQNLRDTPHTLPREPVIQCYVQSGDRLIHHRYDLTEKARMIFELIHFSHHWLRAVASSPHPYVFNNEFELLSGVQEGLHGTRTITLRRLLLTVSPLVLESFDVEELEAIYEYEHNDYENKVALNRVRRALSRLELRTENDLHIVEDFLESTKVQNDPIFASPSLADRIAVFDLVDGAVTPAHFDMDQQRNAAQFAVRYAQSVLEFVDYYRFYMAYIGPDPQRAGRPGRSPDAALEALAEPLLPFLCCPSFPTPPRAQDLPALLTQWSTQSNKVGFPRISAAVAHMAMFARLNGEAGRHAREIIDRYMDRLQNLWLERIPDFVHYTQDGGELEYGYRQHTGHIILRLSGDGNLTIGPHRPDPLTFPRRMEKAEGEPERS
jgi:Domain of unknown function (DUF4157)